MEVVVVGDVLLALASHARERKAGENVRVKGPPLSPYHGSQMSKVEVSLAPVVAIVLMCRPTPGPGLARSAVCAARGDLLVLLPVKAGSTCERNCSTEGWSEDTDQELTGYQRR